MAAGGNATDMTGIVFLPEYTPTGVFLRQQPCSEPLLGLVSVISWTTNQYPFPLGIDGGLRGGPGLTSFLSTSQAHIGFVVPARSPLASLAFSPSQFCWFSEGLRVSLGT